MDGGLGGGVERWRDMDEGMDGWMNGRLDRLLPPIPTPAKSAQGSSARVWNQTGLSLDLSFFPYKLCDPG